MKKTKRANCGLKSGNLPAAFKTMAPGRMDVQNALDVLGHTKQASIKTEPVPPSFQSKPVFLCPFSLQCFIHIFTFVIGSRGTQYDLFWPESQDHRHPR